MIKLIERANQVGLDAFGIGEWRKEFLDSAHAIILATLYSTSTKGECESNLKGVYII
ncbi:MAG TPA: hypothetical protein VI278_08445 [Nitrososphaeraceae archaeon]